MDRVEPADVIDPPLKLRVRLVCEIARQKSRELACHFVTRRRFVLSCEAMQGLAGRLHAVSTTSDSVFFTSGSVIFLRLYVYV
jgi:hypothetical protein